MNETREQLAAYAHIAWGDYMRYFIGNCERQPDGSVVIPAGYVVAIERLINTAYADLPESQKDNDRTEADRMLAIVNRRSE